MKAIEVAVIPSNLLFLCCSVILSRDTLCLQMYSFPSSDEFRSCCNNSGARHSGSEEIINFQIHNLLITPPFSIC